MVVQAVSWCGGSTVHTHVVFKKVFDPSPSWFGSVDRVSACGLKGPGFDSSQGHMPGLRAPFPVGSMQKAADK